MAYTYMLVNESMGIFYVGKGNGDRAFAHRRLAKAGKTGALYDCIRKIFSEEDDYTVVILADDLTDEKAFELEETMIHSLVKSGVVLMNVVSNVNRSAKPIYNKESFFKKVRVRQHNRVLDVEEEKVRKDARIKAKVRRVFRN